MAKFSDIVKNNLSKLSGLVLKHLTIQNDKDRKIELDTNKLKLYANISKDDETSNYVEINMYDNGSAYNISLKDKDDNDLKKIKGTKDTLSIDNKYLFKDNKINSETITGKQIYDLSRHKKICKFDVESESGKGNLQGIVVVDGYLYAHRNVKDNDNGIKSYSPDEKGRIYKFDLDGNLQVKTDDLDKVVHQGLTYYKDDNGDLKLICSGGTDDDEKKQTYKNYIYDDRETYLNAGKKISIVNWDDSENPNIDRYRVMEDYDSDNEKETMWLHSVPTVDADGSNFIVVFSDPKNYRRKLVRVYDHIQTVIDGNYNDFIKEFIIYRGYDINDYYDFQGVAHKNGLIYLYFGSYNSSDKRNREIQIYDIDGNFIKNVKLMPNFITLSDYKGIEPEGITFENENIYIGFHCKNNDNKYEEYLVQLNTGDEAVVIKENIPYMPFTSAAINLATKSGTWFRLWAYDEENNTFNNLLSVTDYGNQRIKGTYMGLMYDPENKEDFNKFVSYDVDNNILQFRAWTDLDTGGSGINLYHKDGNASNAGGIKFFKTDDSDYIFDNLPTSDPNVEGAIWNDNGTMKVSNG